MSGGYCVPSSEILAATPAAAYAGPCYLVGALLISDATNDPKVILYDNATEASGTVLAELTFDVSARGIFTLSFFPPKGIRCENGIWVVVSGDNASVIVYYEERG